MKRVSFDFDGTLSTYAGRQYAKKLRKEGFDVWVVTARSHSHHEDLEKELEEIGIPSLTVVYTAMEDKVDYFKKHDNFIFHLDDDFIECELINEANLKTKAVEFFANPFWNLECEQLIEEYDLED